MIRLRPLYMSMVRSETRKIRIETPKVGEIGHALSRKVRLKASLIWSAISDCNIVGSVM